MSTIEQDIALLIEGAFRRGGRFHGMYEPSEEDGFEEVIPGGVRQGFIYPKGSSSPQLLRLYQFSSGNSELLTAHWRNETRALLRLSARRHPSLPILRDAGIFETASLGYLIIDYPGEPVRNNHALPSQLRGDRARMLRSFLGLVEAVALLHQDGMVHRTITPGSICIGDRENSEIVLDGFHMSVFVSTWLRGHGAISEASEERLLPSSAEHRLFLANERLSPLFGRVAKRLEGFSADVFSLGLLGLAWFLEPSFPTGAEQIFIEGSYDANSHEQFVRQAHSRLTSSGLPQPFARLLRGMSEFSAANRIPSAGVAYEQLCKMYGYLLAYFESDGETEARLYQVCYLFESIERLHRENHTVSPPQEPDYEEYAEFIAADLHKGILTWNDDGFSKWKSRRNKDADKAKIVLIGKYYIYFCEYFSQGRDIEDRRRLVIKFMLASRRAPELRRHPRQRAIPEVRPEYYAGYGRLRRIREAPTWKPFIESVRSTQSTDGRSVVEKASSWLLGVSEGRSVAQIYSCELLAEPNDNTVHLRATERFAGDSIRNEEVGAFASLWRKAHGIPEMSQFFRDEHERQLEEDQLTTFEMLASLDDREPVALLRFDRVLDSDTAAFKILKVRASLPKVGWVRMQDFASHTVRARQIRALAHAANNYQLMAQLKEPRAVQLYTRDDFPGVSIKEPETTDLLHRMLCAWPIFVVQGPPGTGKTFLAAHFVTALLFHDPFTRIVISAQSHDALNNLVERVASILESPQFQGNSKPTILRIATENTKDKVRGRAAEYLPDRVLANQQKGVQSLASEGASLTPTLRRLQKQWRKSARNEKIAVALSQRIYRSASVICVTSNVATTRNLHVPHDMGSFDLAVIEEAARGWLTEMLIPMVHANRWLLIGDQRQLPAFSSQEIQVALQTDISEDITGAVTGQAANDDWRPHLSWFGSLMDAKVTQRGRRIDPRHMLTKQRRMHEDIGNLVSKAYYDRELQNHECTRNRSHMLRPHWVGSRGLVWIDTSGLGEAARENRLKNECEARLLSYVARKLAPFPTHQEDIPSVCVLSPYKKQLELLRKRVHHVPDEAFSTVDSFQGREAEVVFVSLVRNNTFADNRKAIGFLAAPERVNVMFSRARRLLVIIGSLAHFARCSGTHWDKVVEYIRSDDRFYLDSIGPELNFRFG